MIDVQTLDRLKAMRLSGMAEYFENLAATTGAQRPTGPEMVKMAVDSGIRTPPQQQAAPATPTRRPGPTRRRYR